MINEQTVLVLGAGASLDLGFPTGEKLWQDIYSFVCGQSNGSRTRIGSGTSMRVEVGNAKLLANLLEKAVGLGLADVQAETGEGFVKKFAEKLFEAQPRSIDEFLNDRAEYSLIGRICIVFCISRYEDKNSKNFIPIKSTIRGDHDFPDFGWYQYLWHKMTENVNSIEEFKEKNKLTVITFNYDRSLEFYLFRSLKSKYDKHDADTADVFGEIEIKHVYGRLAPFDWEQNYLNQNSDLSTEELAMECNDFIPWDISVLFRLWGEVGTHGVDAGDFKSHRTVLAEDARSDIVRRFIRAANNIKIYSEVIEEKKSQEYLEDLQVAKRIYFLGFGYHEQNLSALGMTDKALEEGPKIFGTTHNMSDGETEIKRIRVDQSICTGKDSERYVTLENNWDNTDSKGSIIKDFFRKVPMADLV
jgi:hypothetical protein